MDQKDSKNRTTLMYIANFIKDEKKCGNLLDALNRLVNEQAELKIKVNEQDVYGKTALMYAIENNNKTATNFLLKSGADVNKQDKEGKTALMYAVEKKNPSLVKILLNNNANIDIRDKEGNTAVDIAIGKDWKQGFGNLNAHKKRLKQKKETTSWQAEESEKNELFERGYYINRLKQGLKRRRIEREGGKQL